jgi:hypothetical protein
VQEENWKTEQEAKNCHAAQRNTDPNDVRPAYSFADEEAKHAVDEIKQPPQFFGWGLAGPQEVEERRGRTSVRENECWQPNQTTPDHPAQALVILRWQLALARKQNDETA